MLAFSNTTIADSQAFLFSLVQPSGNNVIKIIQKAGATGGIRWQKTWGPSFAIGKDFSDGRLTVYEGNPLSGSFHLGNVSYFPSKGEHLTGVNPFDINQMEVFEIDH